MTRFTRRRHCIALAALVAAAGCAKSDKPPAADSIPPAPLASASPTPARVMPGALTKPIDQYSGDEFHDLVKKLSYVGKHDKQRKCKNAPGCTGAKRVKVSVTAVASQDSLAASNAPQFGVVYIRAINDGDAEEARYNLAPGKKFEYYLIVTATPAGGMQWRLERLDTTPSARTHQQVGTGAFEGCNHKWVAGAQADFKTCADSSTASMPGKTVRLGLALQFDEPPLWAACGVGCCIAR